MSKKYLPIDPDYYEIIGDEKEKAILSVVHYFGASNELKEAKGIINSIFTNEKHEEYLLLNSGDKVRLDRIIVINGIPGPAYDEYDSYALACLDCMGGMD